MPPRLLEHLWGRAPQADNVKKATAPSEGSDLDVASNTTPATEHSDDGDHFDDVDVSICSDDLGNLESTVRGLCQSLEIDGFYLHSATAVQAADQRDLVAQRRTTRALSFNDASTAPLTLEEFIAVLPGVVERCNITSLKKCEPVKELFNRLQLGKSEWARFAFWDPDKLYTRNLVATDNRTFTLLLLCWNPGRESPIHDHPCEGCWVKTLQGEVLETIYEQDASSRLVPVRENLFHESELSYIEDSLGFHKVGNTGSVGAVTLHCYIPPPKMCRVWMAPNSRLCDAHMVETALFSAYGQRLPCCSKTMLTQMAATGDK